MKCPDCGAGLALEDNFCPRCGARRRDNRLPAKRTPALAPVLWRQAAPVLARGAALVAAGVVGEWLLRSAARRAVSMPLQRSRPARKERALVPRQTQEVPQPGTVAVSETVVLRRIILRR